MCATLPHHLLKRSISTMESNEELDTQAEEDMGYITKASPFSDRETSATLIPEIQVTGTFIVTVP